MDNKRSQWTRERITRYCAQIERRIALEETQSAIRDELTKVIGIRYRSLDDIILTYVNCATAKQRP